MRAFIIGAAAAVLALCAVQTVGFGEKEEEILCRTEAVLDESGETTEIIVTGVRFSPDSEYFTHIRVSLDGKEEIIPETDEGYGVGVAAFDFIGDGYCQLFYYASSGGSGGYGYFYVFDCSERKPVTVFDYKDFKNEYEAKCERGSVIIYRGDKIFVTYNLRNGEIQEENGVSYPYCEAYVTDLNFVEPVFVYSINYYRLNVWQNVIAGPQVNVLGRIITTMVYDEAHDRFREGFVSVSGSL